MANTTNEQVDSTIECALETCFAEVEGDYITPENLQSAALKDHVSCDSTIVAVKSEHFDYSPQDDLGFEVDVEWDTNEEKLENPLFISVKGEPQSITVKREFKPSDGTEDNFEARDGAAEILACSSVDNNGDTTEYPREREKCVNETFDFASVSHTEETMLETTRMDRLEDMREEDTALHLRQVSQLTVEVAETEGLCETGSEETRKEDAEAHVESSIGDDCMDALSNEELWEEMEERSPSPQTSSKQRKRKNRCYGPFRCEICGKRFPFHSLWERHKRSHTGERPYKCSECEKSFTQKNHMLSHMRAHTGERPYKCSVCERTFIESCHLHVHMRNHSGDKPFKCCHCGKAFPLSGNLKRHLRSHTNERPFECRECRKRFLQPEHLAKHMLFHTDERPCKCSQCEKAFKSQLYLLRHSRRVHGSVPPNS